MQRRDFLKTLSALSLPALSGCVLIKFSRVDPMHVLIRSDVINSLDDEKAVLKKAKLEWTLDGRVRVLYLKGSPYERGYQHGALLRQEIQENFNFMYQRAVDKFRLEELFDESYERMRPFIPEEYIDEMHGLAHGSKMPLHVIHAMHALPSITEWGGKRKIKDVVKGMMDGSLSTSCSNFAMFKSATKDGEMYVVRILDWGLHKISKLHEYPLISVNIPEKGNAYANIGWVGFLGAISGMNEKGITLGEMGYGNPPNETLRGKPMPFVLRDILSYANNLKDVRHIISSSPGDMSFVYLMSDGKSGEAEGYVRDHDRFKIFKPGETFEDNGHVVKPIKDIVYGGHYVDTLNTELSAACGSITPEYLMKAVIPKVAMPSNFQNVVYNPKQLQFWVNNAKSKSERAAEQPYSFFDFGLALKEFKASRS